MFERLFVGGLNTFLGEFLQVSNANIDLWSGRVKLENIAFNKIAIENSGLPFKIMHGNISSLIIDVPWSDFYGKPTTIELEDVYMFAVPKPDAQYDEEWVKSKEWEKKQAQLSALEEKKLQIKHALESSDVIKGSSFIQKFIATLMRNLEIHVHNIHVRYEDSELNPGKTFAIGVMLKEFVVKTTDEQWSPVAMPDNVPTIFKKINLEGMSFYLNCNADSYESSDPTATIMRLKEDIESTDPLDFLYIVHPVIASAKFQVYLKSISEANNPSEGGKTTRHVDPPSIQGKIVLEDTAVTLRKCQFQLIIQFVEKIIRKRARDRYREYRPSVTIHEDRAAWWHFAYMCILEGIVKRRRRMWSWQHMKNHRSLCSQYRLKYREKLEKGLTRKIKAELEKFERELDVYNIVLLRRQAEVKWEQIKQDETYQSNFIIAWIRWLASWFRSSEDGVDDNVFTSEEKKKLNQMLFSEQEAIQELPPEYVSIKVFMKIKSLKLKMKKTDMGMDKVVSHLLAHATNVSAKDKRDKVFQVQLDEMEFDMQLRPGANSIRSIVEIKALDVTGLPPKSDAENPVMARSHQSSDDPFIFLHFETNPLQSNCNTEINLHMLPLDVLVDINTLKALENFFKPPKRIYLEKVQEAAFAKLEEIKDQTRSSLLFSLQSHKIIEVVIKIDPITVVIPSSTDTKTCSKVVVLLGPLDVETVRQDKLAQVVEAVQGKQKMALCELKQHAYDEFIISLANLQLLFAAAGEDWKEHLTSTDDPMHILKPFSAHLNLYKCIVQDVTLPDIRMFGSVPVIHIAFSNQRLAEVVRMVASLLSSEAQSSSSSTDDYSDFVTISRRMTIAKGDPGELLHTLQSTLSETSTKKKGHSSSELCFLQAKFEIDEISVAFTELREKSEHPALNTIVRTIGVDCSICDTTRTITAYVGEVLVQHMQFRVHEELSSWYRLNRSRGESLGSPVDLIRTLKTAEEKSKLLTVELNMILKSSKMALPPKIMSTTVSLQLQGLDVLVHKEAVIHVLLTMIRTNLLPQLYRSPSEDFTPAKRRWLRALKKIKAAKRKEKPKKPINLGRIVATAVLSSISVAVCTDRILLTDIMLSRLQASVSIQDEVTELSAFVENVIVFSCLHSLYPKVVSCEEGRTLELKVTIRKNINMWTKTSSYILSFLLNSGCIKIVFLMKFFSRLGELLQYISFSSADGKPKPNPVNSIFAQLSDIPHQISGSLLGSTVLLLLRHECEFDISLQAPLIIVPESPNSPDVFVANLGLLSIRNDPRAADSDARRPRGLDQILVQLSSLTVSRMLIQNMNVALESPILEPVTVEVTITRNLSPRNHPELPIIGISCRISWISMLVDAGDCRMLLSLLEQNFEEFKNLQLALEKPPEIALTLMTEADVAQIQAIAKIFTDIPMELPGAKDTSTRGYDQMSIVRFTSEIDGIELELNSGSVDQALSSLPKDHIFEHDPEKSILKFQLKMLAADVDMRFDGAFSVSHTMHSCVLRDLRPGIEKGLNRGYVILSRSSSDLQNFITLTYLANPHSHADKNFLTTAQRIQRHYVFLMNAISPHPEFLTHLLNTGILSEKNFSKVMSFAGSYNRNQKLLEIVSEISEADFKGFLDALVVYRQKHVADLLQNVEADTNGFYVAINYVYVAVSMDFVNALLGFVTKCIPTKSRMGQKIDVKSLNSENGVAQNQIGRYTMQGGEDTGRRVKSGRLFDFYFSLNDLEIVILENSVKKNSVALLTKIQVDVCLHDILEADSESLVFIVAVKFKSLMAAIYSNVKSKCEIIGAVEVELDSRIPQITFSDDIVISISPVALNMMAAVLKAIVIPEMASTEAEDIPADLWSAKKITDFNFWFLQPKWLKQGIVMEPLSLPADSVAEKVENKAEQKSELLLERMCIIVRLTDKRSKLAVMSQFSLKKFHMKASRLNVNVSCRFSLESHFYNVKSAAWEPVVDLLDGDEPDTQKPWGMSLEVRAHMKHSSPAVDKQPLCSINCLAPDLLKLTITDVLLQSFGYFKESLELGMSISDILNVPSKGTAPYKLQNESGNEITVRLGRSYRFSQDSNSPVVLVSGQSLEFYNRHDTTNVLLGDDDDDSENKKIQLLFNEFGTHRSFDVTQCGKLAFVLKNEELLRSTWELVTEVEGYFGQVIVTFRSTLQVFNGLLFEVEVYYLHVKGDPLLIGHMMANTSLTIPYIAVYTPPYTIYFKPHGEKYKMSSGFEWKNQENRKPPELLECKSTSREISSIYIQPRIDVENVSYESTEESSVKVFMVYLSPPLVLRNLLPMKLVSEVVTQVNDAADTVEPGRDVHLYIANPKETKLKGTIHYDNKTWIGRCLITSDLGEFMIWTFEADENAKMSLGLHCYRSNGYPELDLFCPYWMVNLTESTLFYRAGMSAVIQHRANFGGAVLLPYSVSLLGVYLERGCSCFRSSQRRPVQKYAGKLVLSQRQADADNEFYPPVDNSDPDWRKNVKISVKLNNSGWSDEFCIDVIGTMERVGCKLNWYNHYLLVNVALSSTGLTKIVTFKPFYTVINQAKFTIWFRENLPSSSWTMTKYGQCLPFWPRHLKEMVAAVGDTPDSTMPSTFTRPFPITTSARTLLKIDHPLGGINVHCMVSETGVQILFRPYTSGAATALLINYTENTVIIYHQVGLRRERRALLPGEAVLYTWQDPLAKRELLWSCRGVESYSNKLDRDGAGKCLTKSKDRLNWLSFLDGKQRILMFTDDKLVVESFREVVTEQIDLDFSLQMFGLAVTLVSNRIKQPIACFSITGFGYIWEAQKKGIFQRMKSWEVAALDEEYKIYSRELLTNKNATSRRKLLNGKIDVDYGSMMLYKPYKKELRRNYSWGIGLNFQLSSRYALVHFKIQQFKLANLLPGAVYETVLSPVLLPESQDSDSGFLELSIVAKNSAYSNIIQLKYFELLIQPIDVQVELSFVLSILHLIIPKAVEEQQLKMFQADCVRVGQTLKDDVFSLNVENFLVFCDLLRISPLEIHISFSWLISQTEGEEKFVGQVLFLQSIGGVMSDINDVELRLGYFERKFTFYTPTQLAMDARNHYSQQALKQMYLFVFGWDILGNPFSVLRDVRHGMEDLFYHPYLGAIDSPQAFAKGLASGTQSMVVHSVGGMAGAGSRITGAVGKVIASVVPDQTYKRKRRELLSRHPNNIADGIRQGTSGLALSLKHGLTGVVVQPFHGAKKGFVGFLKGIVAGIVGVVVIPATGLFDFTSVTFEGIRRSTKNNP